jgi:hypothetical protein
VAEELQKLSEKPPKGGKYLFRLLYIKFSSSFDGKNQSLKPPPSYRRATLAAAVTPEAQGLAKIVSMFDMPVPISSLVPPTAIW